MIREGGSIPVLATFQQTHGLPSILMGFGLDDDRVHAPNEKFSLSSFHVPSLTRQLLVEVSDAPRPIPCHELRALRVRRIKTYPPVVCAAAGLRSMPLTRRANQGLSSRAGGPGGRTSRFTKLAPAGRAIQGLSIAGIEGLTGTQPRRRTRR